MIEIDVKSALQSSCRSMVVVQKNTSGYIAGVMLLAMLSGIFSHPAMAEDEATELVPIRDDETQLALRFAERERADLPFEYSISLGKRMDTLRWSTATATANIADEVEWKDSSITQLRLGARAMLWRNLTLQGAYSSGMVNSGNNHESGYAGDNRSSESFRIESSSYGAVRDLNLALGYKLALYDTETTGAAYLLPLAGYGIYQQNLRMQQGRQTYPVSAPLDNLNNAYDTTWSGGWVGLEALFGLGWNISLYGRTEVHRTHYYAEGSWNLRNDLAQPVGFQHRATGRGKILTTGIMFHVGRNLRLNASYELQQWRTQPGTSQLIYSSGNTGYEILNPVEWNSKTVSLGAVYGF